MNKVKRGRRWFLMLDKGSGHGVGSSRVRKEMKIPVGLNEIWEDRGACLPFLVARFCK